MNFDNGGLAPFLCSTIDPTLLRTEWERWKRAFNIYAGANDLTDQDKLKNKLLHLGGMELQDVFFGIPGADVQQDTEKSIKVFDLAVEKLDQHFAPIRNSVFERHIFRTMKPDSGENFDRFLIRLRKQSEKCNFGNNADESRQINLKDKIIEIASADLKKKLLEKEMTLDDMISLCNVYSQIKNQTEAMSSAEKSSVIHKIGNSHTTKYDKRQITCYKCNKTGHFANECYATNKRLEVNNKSNAVKCFKCGNSGHLAMACRSKVKRAWVANNSSDGFANKRMKYNATSTVQQIEEHENTDPTQVEDENFVFNIGEDEELIDCSIAGKKVSMLIDSGSKNNMIDELTWCYLKSNNHKIMNIRSSTNKIFKAFATRVPLKVKAIFDTKISVIGRPGKEVTSTFYVIEKADRSLLGKHTAQKLGVLSLGLKNIKCDVLNVKQLVKEKFPKIKNVSVDIAINENVKPVIQPLRRAPIALQEQIQNKIQELLDLDIIEPVQGPVLWQSPLVPIIKGDGDLRLCVDMRRANEAIIRENHPLPTFDDLLPMINNAKYFSRLDVKQAFHQLELNESSRYITTFISSKGVYRYKRLMFGVTCAPEIFQKTLERILLPCDGCFNFIDDIIVFGKNSEEHDQNLNHVLSVLKDSNVLLNSSKCLFKLESITFLGHHLSAKGVTPSNDKITALQNFRAPESIEELKSFLGLITYIGRFIPDLGTKTFTLRQLAKSNGKFIWSNEHEKSFLELKSAIGRIESLGYFDKNDVTQVIADASPVALGAVLIQLKNNQPRVICYASKSLTDTEKRYCQTEKEALALVWAVERFSIYLIGLEFQLITDHRPLETIFSTHSKPCARIERWVLRLQSFRYKVIYKRGSSNIADPLSRLYTITNDDPFDEECEQYIRSIAEAVALDNHEIGKETLMDPELKALRSAVETNDWRNIPAIYSAFQNEYSIFGDLILRGTKVLIPTKLRNRVLDIAHEGHPGETKMKQRLRNRVWFPKIDKMVQMRIKQCRGCMMVSALSHPEPMKRREFPLHPWTDVAIDFMGPLPSGDYLLVIIDYYSRYKEIEVMQKITANETIARLSRIFCRLGFPVTITVDNGKQFISEQFKEYCSKNNIHLNYAAPYWPQENGEVERQNRSILKRLKISQIYERDWKKDLLQYLMMYYTTPHSTTGKTPTELMYGHVIRDKLPMVSYDFNHFGICDGEVRDRDTLLKAQQKIFADARRRALPSQLEEGDVVMKKTIQKENKLAPTFDGNEYTVIQKKGAKCVIADDEGNQLIRNSAHLKKTAPRLETITNEIVPSETDPAETPQDFQPTITEQSSPSKTSHYNCDTRSRRFRKPPARYDDYILDFEEAEKRGDVVE